MLNGLDLNWKFWVLAVCILPALHDHVQKFLQGMDQIKSCETGDKYPTVTGCAALTYLLQPTSFNWTQSNVRSLSASAWQLKQLAMHKFQSQSHILRHRYEWLVSSFSLCQVWKNLVSMPSKLASTGDCFHTGWGSLHPLTLQSLHPHVMRGHSESSLVNCAPALFPF